jgi:hypothetical protein
MGGLLNTEEKKQTSLDEKRPIELTTDEALERMFSQEVRDKLKELAGKGDKGEEKLPHR